MNQSKLLDFINKSINSNNKITIETELDHWFGQTKAGEKCQITDIGLLELIECGFGAKHLLPIAEKEDFIELPDGTQFGRTIKALRENGLGELASELTLFATQQNISNGFIDPSPELSGKKGRQIELDLG